MTEQSLSRSGSDGPIRVLMVDDHGLIHSALRYVLLAFEDLEFVGAATSGAEAMSLITQVKPDVVLMDLVMPETNGINATRAIRERWPHIRVIALTNFQDEELVQGVLDAGASGYLLKNVSAAQLVNAIRAAHLGQPALMAGAADALDPFVTPKPRPPSAPSSGPSPR